MLLIHAGARLRAMPPILAGVLLLACASPVGVDREDPRDVRARLFENVLSSGELSHPTELVLHRRGAHRAFREAPDEVLDRLHRELPEAADPVALVAALAELSFLRGDQTGRPEHYLASAIYAWAFLFPADPTRRPEELDPRTRLAADLYNRGLARGLRPEGVETADLSPRTIPLPFGTLRLQSGPLEDQWAGHRLVRFRPADDYAVRGLRSRYRQAGIGAPLIAALERLPGVTAPEAARVPAGLRVPVTVLLRIDDPPAGLRSGQVEGRLELYAMGEVEDVEIGDERIPLEYEPSVAFALGLDGAEIWGAEYAAFFEDRIDLMPEGSDGLFLIRPYTPGLIPLVLVHGTASSPGRWAEVLNELAGDPLLRRRITPWLFFYPTGNPVLISAERLRTALGHAVRELDPQGLDPALGHVVLAGHSQGGLLVRLQATDAGRAFWDAAFDVDVDDLGLDPDVAAWIERVMVFDRVPFVDGVVFMATPHRGSYQASDRAAALADRLISAPGRLSRAALDAMLDRSAAKLRRRLRRLPTSIDNMKPGSQFLRVLDSLPLAEGVSAHSIIAVRGDGPLEEESDGVVAYTSAHLEAVASERVVRSGHSMQAHPDTIAELMRILREHVAAYDAQRENDAREGEPAGEPSP